MLYRKNNRCLFSDTCKRHKHTVWAESSILGEFAKLRKASNTLVMSIGLSVRNNSAPIGRISIKFDIRVFFANLSRNFKCHSNRTKIMGTLHVEPCNYFIISRSILLRTFATLRTRPRTLGTACPEM